jgi:hypothetical protein
MNWVWVWVASAVGKIIERLEVSEHVSIVLKIERKRRRCEVMSAL